MSSANASQPSDKPIFLLIDATPEPDSRREDQTRTFFRVLDANKFITHCGPPLPVLVQCMEDQEHDLDELKRIIKAIPGAGSNTQAESYVKGVIAAIRDLEIWPNISRFYACLNGSDMPKYVCQEWRYISDLKSGDKATIRVLSFPSFKHALVFALAGGDFNLRKWGLHDEWGWKSRASQSQSQPIPRPPPVESTPRRETQSGVSQSQPIPSSPPAPSPLRARRANPRALARAGYPFRSSVVSAPVRDTHPNTPSTPVRTPRSPPSMPRTGEISRRMGELAEDSEGNDTPLEYRTAPSTPVQPKGKQRALPPIAVRGRDTGEAASSSQPKITSSVGAPSANDAQSARLTPRFCSPATLVPPSIFLHPKHASRSLPLICRRSPIHPGVGELAWSRDLTVDDDSLFLRATTNLPPFVEFALRAIGWGDEVLRVVEIAASAEGSRDAFIITLANIGVPMAEGYLAWELLRRLPASTE